MVDGEGTCNLCGLRKPHTAGLLATATALVPGLTKTDDHGEVTLPHEDDGKAIDPLAHPASQRLIISIDSHIEAGIAHLQSTVEVRGHLFVCVKKFLSLKRKSNCCVLSW